MSHYRVTTYDTVYDCAVFGAGYVGLSAAAMLADAGKHVLLVDLGGDVAWESGRALATEVERGRSAFLDSILDKLQQIGSNADDRIDCASAEVVANRWLRESDVSALYYVAPVLAQMAGGLLNGVVVATKAGLRRLVARQWVDATETGMLTRLAASADGSCCAQDIRCCTPATSVLGVLLQSSEWEESDTMDLQLANCAARWARTQWMSERRLEIIVNGALSQRSRLIIAGLESVRDDFGLIRPDQAFFVSSASIVPFPVYTENTINVKLPAPENLVVAVPALLNRRTASIADRCVLGEDAARRIRKSPSSSPQTSETKRPIPDDIPAVPISTDVAVVGAGTGGAVAAIAAARLGAQTTAFDPFPIVGGTGTGGGIHSYYWGEANGLQAEVDRRTAQYMPYFSTRQAWGGQRFHPEAKKAALESMMTDAGAVFCPGHMLAKVEVRNGNVSSALLAGTNGPVQVSAWSWIDGTGDGDLAAFAGSSFWLGRSTDGLPHCYTQSAVWMGSDNGCLVSRHNLNHDSGYVDPTDSEDLTRARIAGIAHHEVPCVHETVRLLGISPLLGLRQGRHIETVYMLQLTDLTEHRTFVDSVGVTGGDCDAHAVDYEFENDLCMLYVWAFGMRRFGVRFQIPYRCLVPSNLSNVWIGCRAVGVSEEVHMFLRMQRHMQRLGEIAGAAAALAVAERATAHTLDVSRLQRRLRETGAFSPPQADTPDFGKQSTADRFPDPLSQLTAETLLDACIKDLTTEREEIVQYQGSVADLPVVAPLRGHVREGTFSNGPWYESTRAGGPAMWRLYLMGPNVAGTALRAVIRSESVDVAWRAALILAAWGDTTAELRLVHAVEQRELGKEYEWASKQENMWARHNLKILPRWYLATAMLRMCGTDLCVPALRSLASDPSLPHNARTCIAVTCDRLAAQDRIGPTSMSQAADLLDALLAGSAAQVLVKPTRDPLLGFDPYEILSSRPFQPAVAEDYAWQLDYAVARARRSLGLDGSADNRRYLTDERALVRKAFAAIGMR